MSGGLGDDKYFVDNENDLVIENSSDGGYDKVYSSVNYTISSDNVEELVLTGSSNINGTGNSADNFNKGK